MSSVIYLIPLIVIMIISVIVVKTATVALKLTGLEEKKAKFQALSAFTGTGFTTKDSELVLENDIRRKIIMILMVLGNAGLITTITALILSFGQRGVTPALINSGVLIVSIFIFYKIATHKTLTRFLTKKIEAGLERGSLFQKRPVEQILHIAKDFGIAEVMIRENCAELNKKLIESSFREKDILVLAIERKGNIIPTPHAHDTIQLGDILICYGKLDNIEKII